MYFLVLIFSEEASFFNFNAFELSSFARLPSITVKQTTMTKQWTKSYKTTQRKGCPAFKTGFKSGTEFAAWSPQGGWISTSKVAFYTTYLNFCLSKKKVCTFADSGFVFQVVKQNMYIKNTKLLQTQAWISAFLWLTCFLLTHLSDKCLWPLICYFWLDSISAGMS